MEPTPDPAFPLLALPNDLADRVAYLLPLADRCSLAASCTTLRTAGRRWFRGAVVCVDSEDDRLEELVQWVQERQALVAYCLGGTADKMHAGLAALPAGQVVAIHPCWDPPQWAAPAMLTALTALTVLSLGHQTHLSSGSSLEEILQPLTQLRALHLSHCGLKALPAALSRCTLVTSLSIDHNQLAGGWQYLEPLAQLQRLWLGGTAHIPSSLQRLTQLTYLILGGSTNVAAGSHHLTALRMLRYLDLSRCSLVGVPAAVSALTALTALHIDLNELQAGFDHLRPLGQLQALSLSHNGLTELPAAVSALTALTILNHGRGVLGGWEHLRPLANLCALAVFAPDLNHESDVVLACRALTNLHPDARSLMLARPAGGGLDKLFELLMDDSFPANLPA